MRPLPRLVPLDAAMRALLAEVAPLEDVRRIPMEHADGRVLAESVRAPFNVPPFDRSAMDGYAVRAADVRGATPARPARLRLLEVLNAGERPTERLAKGTCTQVATGTKIPPGADAVVMVEHTRRRRTGKGGTAVEVLEPARRGEAIQRRGSDISRGRMVLGSGIRLNAARLSALAAMGITEVGVYVRPRVAILPTGSEVVELGTELQDGQVYDSNAFGLAALVQDAGGEPVRLPAVRDDLEDLEQALSHALAQAELVLVSGGTSAGAKDLLPDLLDGRGKLLFHGIKVKPGRPTLAAIVDGRLVLGLPGNPASCLLMAHLLAVPAIRVMAHRPEPEETLSAVLGEPLRSKTGFHHLVPVRLDAKGRAFSVFKDSAATTSLADADGYVRIPAATERLPKGAPVVVHRF